MSSRRARIFVFACLMTLLLFSATPAFAASIDGVLCVGDSGSAVGGALVELWSGESLVATVSSHSDGSFHFARPAGTYTVRVDPTPYNEIPGSWPLQPGWYSQTDEESATAIVLDVGSTAEIIMHLHYHLLVVVQQDSAWPYLEGAVVRLCDADGHEVTRTANLPNSGRWLFAPLADGDYYIYVDMEPYNQTHQTFFESGWLDPRGYIASSMHDVSAVHVDKYATPLVELPVEIPSWVGGAVYAGSSGVGGVEVEYWTDSYGPPTCLVTTMTAGSGAFGIYLPPGIYTVRIDTSDYNSGPGADLADGWWTGAGVGSVSAAAQIEVRGFDSYVIELGLPEAYGVSGTVRQPDGTGLSGTTVAARLEIDPEAPPEILEYDGCPVESVVSDAEGRYRVDIAGALSEITGDVEAWLLGISLHFESAHPSYFGEYFEDSLTYGGAQTVAVARGVDVSVDATLATASRILGQVHTAAGDPLSLCTVRVYSDGEFRASTTADVQGYYEVGQLVEGTYTVSFDPSGFNNDQQTYYPIGWYDGVSTEASATKIVLPAATALESIDATLTEAVGSIAGTVTDGEAELLPNIAVQVERYRADAEPPGWYVQDAQDTDELGAYEFLRLPTGDYRVKFAPNAVSPCATEWYEDAHAESDATTVTLRTGDALTSIDAQLEEAGRIEGRVVDTDGGLVRSINIGAYVFRDGLWQQVADTTTSEGGTYSIRISESLPVRLAFGESDPLGGSDESNIGEWFVTEAWPDQSSFESATPILVGLGQVVTADATIAPCPTVQGFVDYDWRLGDFEVEAMRQDSGGEWVVARAGVQETVIDWGAGGGWFGVMVPTGNYTVEGLVPGTYRLRFKRLTGTYATRYYHGVSTVEAAQDITLSPGEHRTGVDDVLARGGSIQGRVLPASAQAHLYLRVGSAWVWQGTAATDSDAGGTFAFTGLDTGEYTVAVSADDYLPEVWCDTAAPGFTSGSGYLPPDWAESISVRESDTTLLPTIQLQFADVGDSSAPVSTSDAPAGWVNHDVVVRISSTDLAGSPVTIYSAVETEACEPRSVLPPISAEGVTTIRFFAEDAFGNREDTQTAQVRVDTSPPTTSHNAVPSYRSKAIIQFYPRDRYSGPQDTHFTIDGGDEYIGSAAVCEAPGSHVLAYWSTDRAGNGEQPQLLSFYVGDDVTPPVSTVVAPDGWAKAPVEVTMSATDTVAGVDAIFYALDGTTPRRVYYTPLSIADHGETVISYRAVDLYGNTEATRYVTVLADAHAPETTASVMSRTGEATVTLSATDAGSGVGRTSWKLDGGDVQSGTVVPIGAAGTHTVEYRSADAVGNEEAWNELELDVAHPMSWEVTATATAVTYPATLTVSGRLLDSEETAITGKTVKLQYSYDNKSWSNAATATADASGYASVVAPSRLTYYRFLFAPVPADSLYASATSEARAVAVRATLTAPSMKSVVSLNRSFTFYSYMRPRHSNGTSSVVFKFYRKEGTKWVLRKTVRGSNSTSNSTTTKVSRYTSLSSRGSWRVLSYHPADTHPTLSSGYRYFSVR